MRALGLLVVTVATACSSGKSDDSGPAGVVAFGITAVNAGANAERTRPVTAQVTGHTIDPATYPVQQSVSGPPDELVVTLLKIDALSPSGPKLLFGQPDGSGPGVELHLTDGAVDLAAAGITLNEIPTGHYAGANVWISRVVKMRGCVTGLFTAESAVARMYDGNTYTTDALTAGPHRFCTIASKSLLNFLPAGDAPVGTDAEYEAAATGELAEFDIGGGDSPTTAQAVRDESATLQVAADFDVDAATPTKVTLLVDLNRMLRFWPNIDSYSGVTPPAQGDPPGTSYFLVREFNRSVAVFAGDGAIEGYQVSSEFCLAGNCVAGSPPDTLGKEWLTLVRGPSGTVLAGEMQIDDSLGVIHGDVVPTGVVGAADGTVTLPFGLYRDTIETDGTIDGFRFKAPGDPEDACTANPIQGGPVPGKGPFPVWYTRRL